MSPIWRRGLIAPLAVAVVALTAWPLAGAVAALSLFGAGMLGVVVWHLSQLDALARWAGAALEEAVPEGRGTWALAYAAL